MVVAFCVAVCGVPVAMILTFVLTTRFWVWQLDADHRRLQGQYDGFIKSHQERENQLLDRLMAASQANLGEFLAAREQIRGVVKETMPVDAKRHVPHGAFTDFDIDKFEQGQTMGKYADAEDIKTAESVAAALKREFAKNAAD